MSLYLIKPNGSLGFSRVETSNTGNDRRKEYEAEGYRSVTELEFIIANLVSVHNARQVIRITKALAREMGEDE